MKLFLTLFFTGFMALGTITSQETERMNATFTGYEKGMYVFTDSEGFKSKFNHVSQAINQRIDLTNEQYVGKQFIITFTIANENGENDEGIQISTITGLILPH